MDQRTFWAVLLSLLIYVAWFAWFAPVPPPRDESTEAPEIERVEAPAPPRGAEPAPVDAVPEAPARDVPVTLCRTQALVDTRTGALHDVELLDHDAPLDVQPLWRWVLSGFDGPWRPYGEATGRERVLSNLAWGVAVGTGPLTRPAPRVEVVEESAQRLVTRAVTPEGVEIVRTLAPALGEPCRVEVAVTWRNVSGAPFGGGLWVGMHDVLHEQADRYTLASRPRALVGGSVQGRDDLTELVTPQALGGDVGWFGLADAYFASLLVPVESSAPGRAYFTSVRAPTGPGGPAVANGLHFVLEDALPPGGQATARFLMFNGPKQTDLLRETHPSLEDAVELGFLSALAWPLLWLLKLIHGAVGNWGLAIIGLTLLVKLAFFRLTQRSFESSQAMQAIQPMLTEIREKHKDDPEALNRETIKAFQESGVNPLGGCLPMLVQMPVWFALYSVLLSSVELYQAEFLYLRDLSVLDPYLALPALTMGLMIVQQQMMPLGNMDPAQARMMKLMPIVFGFFFFTFPSGLTLYILVNMVLSMLQQWYIKRTYVPRTKQAGA